MSKKTFKGFNNKQTHQLLQEDGYTGPAQKDDMDKFLAASPRAAANIGRYAEIARQRVEGESLAKTGLSLGGDVAKFTANQKASFDRANEREEVDATFEKDSKAPSAVQAANDRDKAAAAAATDERIGKVDPSLAGKGLAAYERDKAAGEKAKDLADAKPDANGVYEKPVGSPEQQQQVKDRYQNSPEARDLAVEMNELLTNYGAGKPSKEKATEALEMVSGTRAVDLKYDTNGDGKITAGDARNIAEAGQKLTAFEEGRTAFEAKAEAEAKEPLVLKEGTKTPEQSEGSERLDLSQKASSDAMLAVRKIANDMTGKASTDVYYRRDDYKGLADAKGSDAYDYQYNYDNNVNKVKYGEDFKTNPDFLARYDIDGDGVYTQTDFSAMNQGRVGQRSVGGFGATAVTDEQWQKVQTLVDEDFVAMYPGGEVTYGEAEADALQAQVTADGELAVAQDAFNLTDIPSTAEALGNAISSPTSLLTEPTVYGIDIKDGQLIDTETGQVADAATLFVKQAEAGDAVEDPAVKAAMAYVAGLSDADKLEKYPPYPYKITGGLPMSDAQRGAISDYYEGQQAQIAQDAKAATAGTYEAITSQDGVKTALEELAAAKGSPSTDALMLAETMDPDELAQLDLSAETLDVIRQIPELKMKLGKGETPDAALFDEYTVSEEVTSEGVGDVDAATFDTDTPRAKAEVDYNLPPTQVAEAEATAVLDAAKFSEYATAEEKQSEFIPEMKAEETSVGSEEVVDVNKVLNSEEVIVAAKTLEALNDASTAKAATATFSQQLEAKLVKGEVTARSTVQGQMEKLMEGFNDGTPAWAAGALRKVNSAMAARGMGSSSMAGAAMIQAAMESAIPIAQADASTFAAMNIENMRNEQTVALANAAAAQGFELANLNNEQATRIQNSMNNANLQLTNLSNEQEAVLAAAGFKASLQGQELSISANVALANAARYASVNDINLTNRQQSSILKSTQNLDVEMANLSNSQQTALSNLQVQAAMQGQDLTNEQQMAVLESTQNFESSMEDATRKQSAFMQDAVAKAAMEGRVLDNKQQTALFNISNEVAERGIELNNEQQTNIFNMSSKLTIEVEELSGRQATALANAQIEAAMKGQELTNKQQVNVITAERIAEVANMNFTAEQSRAIQNSTLAQTVDLANLSNKQAKLMADVASMANVDMANLDNRQQAAAQQAQAFLGMEMSNLDNEQQATMFESQSLVQSIFSDQAAENANLQFNAESINQVNQFYDSMSTSVSQFNKAQEDAMSQFNASEDNTMERFQAELDNQRDIFNAQNDLVIAQANTVWRQSVATINTAELNEANMEEVRAANGLTMQALDELWQQERDLFDMAYDAANNQLDRDNNLAVQNLKNDGSSASATATAEQAGDNALSAIVGELFTKGFSKILQLT